MKLFCWIFILSVAVIPLVFTHLYPYSTFPMFSDNSSEHLLVEVLDFENNQIAPQQYGLRKFQLYTRDQRYGYDPGPNYFESNTEIELSKLRSFLATNFPKNKYPITVRYRTRGYDETAGCVVDICGPTEFVLDINRPALLDNESERDHE
mgnify:CR=1 FL=1